MMCEGKAIRAWLCLSDRPRRMLGKLNPFNFWCCQGWIWVYVEVEPQGFQCGLHVDKMISFAQGNLQYQNLYEDGLCTNLTEMKVF